MQIILFLIVGILIHLYFGKIRNFIIKNAAKKAKGLGIDEIVGKRVNKNGEETFQVKKFLKAFKLNSLVLWIKDFLSIFNLRKVIIYVAIISTFFAYGWYQGKLGKAVKIDLGYGKEAEIRLNGTWLHIYKNGDVWVEDSKGNKIKQITVKDIPHLKRKLAPIGLEFVPIGVVGYGMGRLNGFEGGAGFSLVRYWSWRLESFLTNKGIYIGNSYKFTDNSALGIGVGKGFKGDSRAIIYYRWEF